MTEVAEIARLETVVIEGERLEVVEAARQGPPGPPGKVDADAVNAAVSAWLAANDLPGAVRYDRAQALTENERERARANIGLHPIDCGVF